VGYDLGDMIRASYDLKRWRLLLSQPGSKWLVVLSNHGHGFVEKKIEILMISTKIF